MYIPKANGKLRALGIPTMLDRAYQALHLLGLDPVAEVTGDPNSYGFRRERSTADAIQKCFILLARKSSAHWILEADIEACFDKLSHDWLVTHIPMHKASLRQWLKAGYMEKHVLHPTPEGSPQGGPISPVLANMALDGLEELLHKHFPAQKRKVHLVRYADDFIITAAEKATLEEGVVPLVQSFLAKRGLRLSPTKTTITHIDDGFDFLGQTVRKYNGKLLITPSKKTQKALLEKVRTIIKTEGRSLSAVGLINRLNPIIRGWANYHRHVVSKRTFQRIDYLIRQALWQWAVRRHRNKSRTWIRRTVLPTTRGTESRLPGLDHRQVWGKDNWSISIRPVKHPSVATSRFGRRPTPMTPSGNCTSSSGSSTKSATNSDTDPTSSPSCACKRADVLCVDNPSPRRPDGMTIISDGGYSAAGMNSITVSSCIQPVTNRFTVLIIPVHRCVPYRTFEMLEPRCRETGTSGS